MEAKDSYVYRLACSVMLIIKKNARKCRVAPTKSVSLFNL